MAVTGLVISGRLVDGETLTAWALGNFTSLQWQALVNGQWVNVGAANSTTLVVSGGATGTAYRVAGVVDGVGVTSEATGAASVDSRKNVAPVLSGPDMANIGGENVGPWSVFERFTLTDGDRASYMGGSLLVANTNAGDPFDQLSIRTSVAGGFSYNAATREVSYTGGNKPVVIGTVDAVLDGNGKALKVNFDNSATAAMVDSLIDNIQFANNDDSPASSRLLTLRVTDGSGASAQRVFAPNTTPEPDAPLFTSPAAITVDENQAFVGVVTAVDPDVEAGAPQGVTFSLVAGEGAQDNARFTLDAAGRLAFANPAGANYEDASHAPVYSARVRATDSEGSVTDQVVTVNVRNVNDAPTATTITATLDENNPTLTLIVGVSDQDGDPFGISLDASQTLGAVTLQGHTASTATFTYDPNGKFESLAAGQSATDSFRYTAYDSRGATSTQTITLTIRGENDAAVISGGTLAATIVEDSGNLAASGQVNVSDVDQGQSGTLLYYGGSTYGLFRLQTSGQWTYNAFDDAMQGLRAGQDVVDSFTVYSLDGTASTEVRVTLRGTNDTPTLLLPGSGSVSEAGASGAGTATASGSVTVIDRDAGETHVFGGSAQGNYGSFNVDPATGAWVYTLDNARAATQALTGYDWKEEAFSLYVTDSGGAGAVQPVRIFVNGADDAPVVTGGDVSGAVNESAPDGKLVLSNGAARGQYSVDTDAAGDLVVLGSNADPQSPSGGLYGISAGQTVYRFNADGTLAQSFAVNYGPGSIDVDANGGYILAKTQTAGTASGVEDGGGSDFSVTRYLASGQVDIAFGTSGKATGDFGGAVDTLRDAVTLADGRLLLAGDAAASNGSRTLELARLDAHGKLDATFGNGGRVTYAAPVEHTGAWHAVATADGAVVAWGEHALQGGAKEVHLVRLLADGSLDAGFGNGGFLDFSLGDWYANRGADVEVDASGRILVGWGKFDYDSAVGYRPMLTALKADGSPDASFGNAGTADTQVRLTYGSLFDIALDAQGRILITGDQVSTTGAHPIMVARVGADGAMDSTFGTDGVALTDVGNASVGKSVFALPGGDIVVAGSVDEAMATERAAFVRYNPDGSLEQGFGGPPDEIVRGLLTATDVDSPQGGLLWSGTADGTYGRLTMYSSGNWEYRVDNARAATQALDAGQTVTETFTTKVRDDFGATATQTLVVTVVGAYDTPVT